MGLLQWGFLLEWILYWLQYAAPICLVPTQLMESGDCSNIVVSQPHKTVCGNLLPLIYPHSCYLLLSDVICLKAEIVYLPSDPLFLRGFPLPKAYIILYQSYLFFLFLFFILSVCILLLLSLLSLTHLPSYWFKLNSSSFIVGGVWPAGTWIFTASLGGEVKMVVSAITEISVPLFKSCSPLALWLKYPL